MTEMRQFDTGATRDADNSKYDFEGFLSPYVVEAFGAYMNFNRVTAKGVRDSDNWQKGIPSAVYMKSAWRHFFDWWSEHRSIPTKEGLVWALCGLLFNVQGYLHELLKANPYLLTKAVADAEKRRAKLASGLPKSEVDRCDCAQDSAYCPVHSVAVAVKRAGRKDR